MKQPGKTDIIDRVLSEHYWTVATQGYAQPNRVAAFTKSIASELSRDITFADLMP